MLLHTECTVPLYGVFKCERVSAWRAVFALITRKGNVAAHVHGWWLVVGVSRPVNGLRRLCAIVLCAMMSDKGPDKMPLGICSTVWRIAAGHCIRVANVKQQAHSSLPGGM